MPLRIKCPNGHTLIVPDDRAGRTLKCPRCDQPVVVPGGEADAAGTALLSVLAEGIPAAALSASSLRVGPIEPRSASGLLRADETRTPTRPPQPVRAKPSTVRAPVVKPKSRVLPQPPVPKPEPEPMDLAQPETAPPSPVVIAQLPTANVEAKSIEPVLSPEPTSEPAPPAEPVVAVEPTVCLPPVESESVNTAPAIVVEPPHWPSFAEEEPIEPAEAPPLPAEPLTAEPPAPPRFVPQVSEAVTVNLNADAARTLAVYQLAAALVAAALFSVAPAVWDVVEFLQFTGSPFVARWALMLFFLGVVQLAYAVYLFQLPDWTTVWVVTLFSLLLAAVYAAVLGLVLLSPTDGFLVGNHGLQLADKLAGGKAALWCLCMVSLSTILAFFAGRQSTAWYRAEMMLRGAAI
jgi:hypothetical protein